MAGERVSAEKSVIRAMLLEQTSCEKGIEETKLKKQKSYRIGTRSFGKQQGREGSR